jgi:hypothetical protein
MIYSDGKELSKLFTDNVEILWKTSPGQAASLKETCRYDDLHKNLFNAGKLFIMNKLLTFFLSRSYM